MGWLANFVFGDPNHDQKTGNDSTLPKAVESWQSANGKQTTTAVSAEPATTPEGAAEQPQDRLRDERGLKIVPEVEVSRVESKLSSDSEHCEVWAELTNNSEVEVEVTQVNFLKQRLRMGRFLKPGESRQERVYSGDTPHTDAYNRCEVMYRVTENGDYFQADHLVEYNLENDGDDEYYVPEDMRLIRPIRDV